MNYESLEALMAPPLVAWLFGHTHFNADFCVQRSEGVTVRVASNQQGYIMGYRKDKAPRDYSPRKVIVFPNAHAENRNVECVPWDEFRKACIDKSQLATPDIFGSNPNDVLPSNSPSTLDSASAQAHNGGRGSFCQIL